jgi:Undecaprenyl-phosphate glucose phosphotransferase
MADAASTKNFGSIDALRPASIWAPRLHALLIFAACSEFLLVCLAGYFGAALYHLVFVDSWPDPANYVPEVILIATLNFLVSFGSRDNSRILMQPRHVLLWSGLRGICLVFAFFISAMFLLKISQTFSRGAVITQMLSIGTAILCGRAIWFGRVQAAVATGLVDARRAILIGDATYCSQFANRVAAQGIKTLRTFRFPTTATAATGEVGLGAGHAREQLRNLVEECRSLGADDILLLISQQDVSATIAIATALSELPTDVHVVPVGSLHLLSVSGIVEFGNAVTMRVFRAPLSRANRLIKRAFDIIAAIAGLTLLAPVLVLAALAIKLDTRGPVFFRQTRHGYNNIPIRVIKFRSMTVMEKGDRFRPATRGDPRVTRVGRILRRTNIDELPQLFNVLVGDMSIVGPRPHATSQNDAFGELIPMFFRRHNVKPGITGWAQVNGCRGEVDSIEKMRRRLEYDLYYLDNWSLLLDLKIIVSTLFSPDAYLNAY